MKKPLALLGATGLVGQTLITFLENDPEYYLAEISGSDKRLGKTYGDECHWILRNRCPDGVKALVFKSFDALDSRYVISALPSKVARDVEPKMAQRGHIVFSNSAAHRLSEDGFLIVPEVNGSRLEAEKWDKTQGVIITNPNCVVAILSLVLAPLIKNNLLQGLSLTTLQSASGAGYPGVPSLDLMGNLIPYIAEEEEKIKEEIQHLFQVDLPISVQCNRVPTPVGHLISCEVTLSEAISCEGFRKLLTDWSKTYAQNALKVCQEIDAPQPSRTLQFNDMTVYVGRIQTGMLSNQLRFVVLGDNLGRGAAGAALANMKLYDRRYKE